MPGPLITSDGVDFSFPDAWGVQGVRLETDFSLAGTVPEFQRSGDEWALHLPRPEVDRFEYQFTVRSEGGTTWIADPRNPDHVPNPFGDKSEICFPEYRPPQWLTISPAGARLRIPTTAGELSQPVPLTVWWPAGLRSSTPAPLLVANDGSDMAARGSMLRWATGVAQTRPFRLALLDPAPGLRDEWYAASSAYADHLASVVLPAVRERFVVSHTVGLGASLGALSMLWTQRRHPGLLDAVALQSGSYFTAVHDPQESSYERFGRICEAVTQLAAGPAPQPTPVLITCGAVEENRTNNEQMARALSAQGYPVDMRIVRDAHTMIGWRDAWSPGLEQLLEQVASQ